MRGGLRLQRPTESLRKMSKCDSYARFFAPLLFVLSLAFCSLGFSATSHAASTLDGMIQTTDKLLLNSDTPDGPDVTTRYTQIMHDTCPAIYDEYQDAITAGGSWSIMNLNTFYRGNAIYIVYSPEPGVDMSFSDAAHEWYSPYWYNSYRMHFSSAAKLITLYYYSGSGFDSFFCDQASIATDSYLSASYKVDSDSQNKFAHFLSTFDVQYPEGYEGDTIPDSWEPKPVVRPDFTYQVADKKVTAHDYRQDLPAVTPEEGYTIKGYSVEWSLFKCGSWDDTTKLCNSPSLKKYGIQLQDEDFTHSVDDYGDYTLEATYMVQECYRYPSYPATPDYCVYLNLSTELPDYDFDSTTIHLHIDGKSFSGDTKDMACDVSGYCEVPVVDCESKETFIDQLTCQFNQQFNVGVLNPSITAFKNLFTAFMVPSSPPCSLAISNVTVASHTFPLSQFGPTVCTESAQLRSVFPLASILVNGMLALAILSMIATIINRITNNNEQDIIQGV